MSMRLRRAAALAVIAWLSGCGGSDGGSASVEALPAGSGTYFTSDFLGSASFYKVDEFTGETAQQSTDVAVFPAGTDACPPLAALDARSDGAVLAVARRSATLYQADPRNGLCRGAITLPETMAALAVHPDGRLFTVSVTNVLYQFDAQGRQTSSQPLLCATVSPQCPVRGIDFAPNGTLHAIVAPGEWSRIDPKNGQITTLRTGVGLSDDFDIDAQGRVRGLAGDELRLFDLGGLPGGRAVNVYGGTAFATGVVHR